MGDSACRLCLKESELRNSHILPEFLYKNAYDEKHRTLLISHEKEKVVQKGIRESLFCQKCETKLSRYENYASGLIHLIPNFNRDDNLGLLYSHDVDYAQFKLFQLSILWRAGISKVFNQINLGPHQERIRILLDEENPGKVSDYGCLMSITLETELLQTVIQSPTRFTKKLYGHTAYKFVTGNLTWVFLATSHKIDSWLQELFLQESGLLRVVLSRHDEKSQLMKIGHALKRIEGK